MKSRPMFQTAVLFTGWFISSFALAGNGAEIGDITHAPTLSAMAVPALGGLGLLVLATLLGLFGFRVLKSDHGAGTKFLLAACLATALASGTSGIKLISNAWAPPSQVSLTNADGDTRTLYGGDVNTKMLNGGTVSCGGFNGGEEGFIEIHNNTGEIQFITDRSISGAPCEIIDFKEPLQGGKGVNGGEFLGECTDAPPLEMAPLDSCKIAVCCMGHI